MCPPDRTTSGKHSALMLSSRREAGTAFYEAAIATPLFVILVFFAVQFMMVGWRSLSVQFVATQILRVVATGQCDEKTVSGVTIPVYCNANGLTTDTLYDANGAKRLAYAQKFGLKVAKGYGLGSSVNICIQNATASTTCTSGGGGSTLPAAGEMVRVLITNQSPLLFDGVRQVLNGGNVLTTGMHGPTPLQGLAVGRVERD